MKKSTRNIMAMHGARIDRAAHNYIYFAFYDIYVRVFLALGNALALVLRKIGSTGWPFKMVFERYHAKVVPLSDATRILTLTEDVIVGPDRTEKIIPYRHANQIILKEPDFIAVMDCPCRSARENPCLPLDVCIAVGRTTAEFWLEHGAKYNVRKISQDEAIEKLEEGHRRGHITTAWFKVATGGRTGVICSCCSCCCGGLEGMRLAKSLKGGDSVSNIVSSGYSVAMDAEACDGCGTCARTCIFEAAWIEDGRKAGYDPDRCMGCGLCVEKCERGARKLVLDETKGYPLDIDFIIEELGVQGGGR